MRTGSSGWLIGAVVAAMLVAGAGCKSVANPADAGALSKALGQAKILAGLTDAERTALQAAAALRQAKPGERIIVQGKPLDRMFIILEGQAEVKVNGKTVAAIPAQSLVGEVEFLDRQSASADVVMLKESSLIELNNAALADLMDKQPRIGFVLMREIARLAGQRLRAMDQK